ncbi:MAG: sugar nucleotide-binding protein [Polyangiaceae bacterium]
MSTLIFGAGYLGNRLATTLPNATLVPVDVIDRDAVKRAIQSYSPTAVVNAAGKTGKPNVDWCESHPVETYRANVVGALTVAEVCANAGVYLVHLGSGCIFYGPSPDDRGWREDDFANPTSLYSRTKYAADLVLSTMKNVAIGRLRMPIDSTPGARNLITKLAAYKQVVDVANSVTIVDDLAGVIRQLIEKRGEGVFHITNPGVMRHRDLLALYRELVDPSHTTELITADELVSKGLALKARSNCVLASDRLRDLGITMRPIDIALRDTMLKYAEAVRKPATAR